MVLSSSSKTGMWALYFDDNDEGFRRVRQPAIEGKKMLELTVCRKELSRER